MPEDKKSRYTEAQNKATQKYVKNKYDRIMLTVPKGDRDKIQSHANIKGESTNGFIKRAIDETMERDNSSPAANE